MNRLRSRVQEYLVLQARVEGCSPQSLMCEKQAETQIDPPLSGSEPELFGHVLREMDFQFSHLTLEQLKPMPNLTCLRQCGMEDLMLTEKRVLRQYWHLLLFEQGKMIDAGY